MNQPSIRVFISSTTADLGTYRMTVEDAMLALYVHPISQRHFGPDPRTIEKLIREKIEQCDVVICLVGRIFGCQPILSGNVSAPRSYTQMEYDIAKELGKTIFVFLAADDCSYDSVSGEPDALRQYQLQHIEGLKATNLRYMQFRSHTDLDQQVRLMRFDSLSLGQIGTKLSAVLCAKLSYDSKFRKSLRDRDWIESILQPYYKVLDHVTSLVARDTNSMAIRHDLSETEQMFQFPNPYDAIQAGLMMQQTIASLGWNPIEQHVSFAAHLGQVVHFGSGHSSLVTGDAIEICRKITEIGVPQQFLVTTPIFSEVAQVPISVSVCGDPSDTRTVHWAPHGRFVSEATQEFLEIIEVGPQNAAPFKCPIGSASLRPAARVEFERLSGWKPTARGEVPGRSGWVLERMLGQGGFGETWLAIHLQSKLKRAFKFCRDPQKLSSLKRELSAYRILCDKLGNRSDIVSIYDVQFTHPPYCIESEYLETGSLQDWFETVCREVTTTPNLTQRISIVRQVAATVQDAHSIGLLHKDVKPSNVLLRLDASGIPSTVLADFGIGHLLNRKLASGIGVTHSGFTELLDEKTAKYSGSRMYTPLDKDLFSTAVDSYAIGVMLFQMIVGDLNAPLGNNWRNRIAEVLCHNSSRQTSKEFSQFKIAVDDIDVMIADDPSQRISAKEITRRLSDFELRVMTHLDRSRSNRRIAFVKRFVLIAIIAFLAAAGWGQYFKHRTATALARREAFLDTEEIPGCVASKARFRAQGFVAKPALEVVNEFGDVDYSGFTILKTSSFFDLSEWKEIPIGKSPISAGEVEPSNNTRVIELIRKSEVSLDNSKLRVQYFTSGYDTYLKCVNFPFKVRARADREYLGGKTRPTAGREIEIDLHAAAQGERVTVVLHATVWNGFQYDDSGKQWAAILALDNLGEADLAIKFPSNMKPLRPPRLLVYPRGSEKVEVPLETQNFINLTNSPSWAWRPQDVKSKYVYQFEFDWKKTIATE